ncbi:hypothetical protein A3K73_00525 [Candidatus Pacearchaeota archaeon RBG_13_36_9]|nr:MAG: hypothetical protein A3K73_00525 [Candidatus Pacearchaeota archaeon RBG_13_36_9]
MYWKMKDDKDKSERLRYLNEQKQIQNQKRRFYLDRIEKLKKSLLGYHKKGIEYNRGWIAFHEKSIERHKKEIQEVITLNEKQEQEEKLKFHIEQIESHHKKYIEYHEKEIGFLEKEVQLFERGIKSCEEQLIFLNKKIEENKIA